MSGIGRRRRQNACAVARLASERSALSGLVPHDEGGPPPRCHGRLWYGPNWTVVWGEGDQSDTLVPGERLSAHGRSPLCPRVTVSRAPGVGWEMREGKRRRVWPGDHVRLGNTQTETVVVATRFAAGSAVISTPHAVGSRRRRWWPGSACCLPFSSRPRSAPSLRRS